MRYLLFLFGLSLAAADTTLYVNTASTAGGDCTTNATAGANRACPTLFAAEALLPADITTGENQGVWTILCEGTAADTTNVVFSGTVTDAAHYILVRGNALGAAWDDTKYRIQYTSNTAESVISLAEKYVKLDRLQIYTERTTYTRDGIAIPNPFGGVEISHCLVRGNFSGTAGPTALYAGISITTTQTTPNKVWNNIVSGWTRADGALLSGIRVNYATAYLYNNTTVGNYYGILRSAGTVSLKNNLATGNAIDYSGTFAVAVTNLSGDTSSPNSELREKSVTFLDAPNSDYHLGAADPDAIGTGTDLSGDLIIPFAVDIDGQVRGDNWDVGADQHVAAVTAVRRKVVVIQ